MSIKELYTLLELREKVSSGDYSAELLLQHAMVLLKKQEVAAISTIARLLRVHEGKETLSSFSIARSMLTERIKDD